MKAPFAENEMVDVLKPIAAGIDRNTRVKLAPWLLLRQRRRSGSSLRTYTAPVVGLTWTSANARWLVPVSPVPTLVKAPTPWGLLTKPTLPTSLLVNGAQPRPPPP